MKKYGFGVDVGGTTIKMGFFETDGTLLSKWEIKTDKTDNGANVLSDIAKAINGKCEEAGITKDDIQGIGIGVPGPVTADGIVHGCVNLGWGNTNVSKKLGEMTGLPVAVGNDANVAALGEMWMGGGKGCKDLVMVTLGTGVGGGIIINGKIVAGANGAGGEIGHMTVNEHEMKQCNCGQYGCLEQYCSATGIVRMAKRKLAQSEADTVLRKLSKHRELSAKAIFDAAKSGDMISIELVEELGRILGHALSNIAVVTNPEVIVIGGGVSKAGSYLIGAIQKHYLESAFRACRGTRFELAQLGNDAGIYGSMQMILE